MSCFISMNDIKPGQSAIVREMNVESGMHRRFLDIGLIHDTKVECLGRSPGGDPSAYLIRGAVIAIRAENCKNVLTQLC